MPSPLEPLATICAILLTVTLLVSVTVAPAALAPTPCSHALPADACSSPAR